MLKDYDIALLDGLRDEDKIDALAHLLEWLRGQVETKTITVGRDIDPESNWGWFVTTWNEKFRVYDRSTGHPTLADALAEMGKEFYG